jgi:hypothetical protein
VSRETGFAVEDHLLELIGLCATCQWPGDTPDGKTTVKS